MENYYPNRTRRQRIWPGMHFAGGLLTTASDYAAFMIGLFAPKENDSFRLNKRSLMEMVRPQVKLREGQKIDGASSWALGWA